MSQQTIVTGTITDPSGNPYKNCSYSVSLVNNTGLGTLPLLSGSTFQTVFDGGSCDSFGSFSQPLFDNNQITPLGTQWKFSVCDITGKTCFTYTTPICPAAGCITGLNISISSAISAVAPSLTIAGNATVGGNNTFTGSNLFVGPINNIQQVTANTVGATASDKIATACAALPPSGGTIDVRPLGAGTQSTAAPIQCGSSTKPVTFYFDPATKFQPGSSAQTVFTLSNLNQVHGLTIDTTNQATYSGNAIANASTNIGVGTAMYDTFINMPSGTTGNCFGFNESSGSIWMAEVNFFNTVCNTGVGGVGINVTIGGAGFWNGNNWYGVWITTPLDGVQFNVAASAAGGGISRNGFYGLNVEALSNASVRDVVRFNAPGGGSTSTILQNKFFMDFWDQTAANHGFNILGGTAQYCGNKFEGALNVTAANDTSVGCVSLNVWKDLQNGTESMSALTAEGLTVTGANSNALILNGNGNQVNGSMVWGNGVSQFWNDLGGTPRGIAVLGSDNNLYISGCCTAGSGPRVINFQPQPGTNAFIITNGGITSGVAGQGDVGSTAVPWVNGWYSGSIIGKGTLPALSGTGTCATISNQVGGALAGSAKCTGTAGAATLTITFATTTPNGYICTVEDETTRADLFQQTSHTTTSCTMTATAVAQNDIFVFSALGF